MGILDWMGLGKEISEPIKAVGDLYTTDKARIEAQKDLAEVTQKPQLSQLEINKILAATPNFFTNSWQPLLGWTAGFLVLLYYAPQIIIVLYVWGGHCISTGICSPFPMRPDDILNLVYLLFGFGVHSIVSKK